MPFSLQFLKTGSSVSVESKGYLQVCVIWPKIWIVLSEIQFPLEFRLYGNLGQFCAIMEEQTEVFLLAPMKKCLLGLEAGKFAL